MSINSASVISFVGSAYATAKFAIPAAAQLGVTAQGYLDAMNSSYEGMGMTNDANRFQHRDVVGDIVGQMGFGRQQDSGLSRT